MDNLLNHPTYKIADRRAILVRLMAALLRDDNCTYPGRGPWQKLTPEEIANWEARETVVGLLRLFPPKPRRHPFR